MNRILMVSEPGRYGVFVYVRNFVRFLHVHHPHLIVDFAYSSRRNSPELAPFVAEIKARGGETIDLRVSNAPEPGDVSATMRLLALILRRRPAVIHAHSSKAGARARLLKLLPSLPPVLYTPHGYYGMSLHGGAKELVFNAIESVLGHIGRTHNVSIHERQFAHRVLHLPLRRLLLVFSGIDLDTFRPASAEQKRAARESLGLPSDGRLLVTVGRDAYEKDYGDLYAALDHVLPHADWHFVHAGAGSVELRDRLRPAAREHAHAFRFLDRPETLYHAADGFVLVSRSEAFGLSAYEALACGLPLILSATTGLLSLGKLGFPNIHWVPNPADAGDISRAVVEALRQWADAPNADPCAAQAEMREWFEANMQFEKLVHVYRHLALRHGGDPEAFEGHTSI